MLRSDGGSGRERDLLWPDGIRAWTSLILPSLSLLHEICTPDELDAEYVVLFLGMFDGCEQVLRLSCEIRLVCPAEKVSEVRARPKSDGGFGRTR